MADLREGDIRLLVKVEVSNLLPRFCSPSLRIYVVSGGTCWANVWGDGRMSVSSVNVLVKGFTSNRFLGEVVLAEAERFYVAMSSYRKTIPRLDACRKENFDSFGDTGDIDATESLLDIGMKTEEEYLGEESPNEENCEHNGYAEHVVFGRAQILEMKFENPDEACHFYEQYSRAKGFAMRQGKKLKNKKGKIVRYMYLCNREGFRDRKWLEMPDRKREHKVVTRCGCQAEMRIKKISDVDRAHMDSLRQVGISITKIYESIAAQASYFNLVPFTKRDMYNVVRRQHAMQSSDVNAALQYFNIAWATAYIRGCFYAGLRTTSRCESLHAKM
ncbi:hypothetical protein Ahy_A01g000256 [Arachis hypogaea]|uniref:FAR1 domain-containing protein n=1 Tax=Arachis hypogaea TaxID=3818 RepID=A0A445EJT9_ARAHY|nr:hypothetical protein Ahy_A01g000256 [Arachis hypogaea]